MAKRLPLLPLKRDAFKAILRFLTNGDVRLKVEEEAILKRWEHCDMLLRAKSKSEQQIADEIVEKFYVSVHTARNDIYNTQQLFAKSRQINKKYLIHHHLERIDRDIQLIRSKLFSKSDDGKLIIPNSKEMVALAKMYETYTYTLNCVPEEQLEDKQPPPVFQFILAPGQVIERPMQITDAINMADEIILKQNKEGIYEDPRITETELDNTTEEAE